MASILRSIYHQIAEAPVLFGTTPVRVRGLDNLVTQVNRANLPLRVQLPVGANASGRSLVLNTADGIGREAVWTIPELALLGEAPEGKGLEEFAGQLIDYIVAFEDGINVRRTAFTGFVITDLAFNSGMFEWPKDKNVWYYGVQTVLTAKELI